MTQKLGYRMPWCPSSLVGNLVGHSVLPFRSLQWKAKYEAREEGLLHGNMFPWYEARMQSDYAPKSGKVGLLQGPPDEKLSQSV